ncbi:procollagen C-endopeptidase enhancer 1-like [Penaeus indicus]|uniref:procollagen C-endopeptidase enhancer 1-like n=1 Tax=Penaeus indicus TaxID=29960 RepID=UPI00300C2430
MATKGLWTAVFALHLFAAVRGQRCGGEVDTALHPSGTITSPSYPEHYPEDTHCTWVIKAPHGEKIALTFVDFDVTGSDGCSGDYVSLASDLTSEGQRFCGSQGPGDVTSDGDILVLRFASNAQGSCRGFNASYHVKEESLSCGVETSALEFTFISPDYPQPVGNDSLECSVTVDHGCESPICQLRLDFEDFQLQPPYWGDCKYDQFYAESSTPLPTLCGVNNGSHMYVNVEGRSKTDLTFLLGRLEYYLYHCYDIYGSIPEGVDASEHVHSPDHARRTRARRDVGEEGEEEEKQRERVGEDRMGMMEEEEIPVALPDLSFARQGGGGGQSSSAVPVTSDVVLTTEGDVTVALYNYKEADIVTFPTRRAWKVRVTQIPCDCPKSRVPKAPEGCLQYHQGLTGDFKSFNFEGVGCYSEDRWCDFSTIKHPSDCDIRVGYTGHFNDLDYSICVEPESGFCGIQYQQMGRDGFSLTNATAYQDDSHIPSAEFADSGCMADYLWVPGAENDHGTDTHERFCGTKLGNARKWGTVTTYSKPFTVRMVSDADEFSLAADYMNRGFHISYSQIPCKLSG